jgi:hypothetical protein
MLKKIKLIIAGSREITNNLITFKAINEWRDNNSDKLISLIISGMARGPDSHAIEYANNNHIPYVDFIPDWEQYGKKAGILRNLEMAKSGDELIAIFNGKSKGTSHMIDTMLRLSKPVWLYNIEEQPLQLRRIM